MISFVQGMLNTFGRIVSFLCPEKGVFRDIIFGESSIPTGYKKIPRYIIPGNRWYLMVRYSALLFSSN